jgi:putative endonuclease
MCDTDDRIREDIAMPGSILPIGMRPVPGTLLKRFAIYILTNRPRGVLYVGVTSWLQERIRQHREGDIPGFTRRYNLERLVYFEYLDSAAAAIAREKRLKRWRREWKIALIEEKNPTWRDLWPDITEL